mgnify:CR=1 FL=1
MKQTVTYTLTLVINKVWMRVEVRPYAGNVEDETRVMTRIVETLQALEDK